MLRHLLTSIAVLVPALPAWTMPVPATIAAGFGSALPPHRVLQGSEERPPGPADLREAIEIAQRAYGGQEAGAETVERDGRTVHEVKLFGEDGTVRTVRIDPQTGAIIPQERDQR